MPDGIGNFDFVILSAVYEHLLPTERNMIVPLIYSLIKPEGILFSNQTPFRYFFIETHTTSLPFINYLPDRLTHFIARSFCNRVNKNETWETLLRRGIRGGTVKEIKSIIKRKLA